MTDTLMVPFEETLAVGWIVIYVDGPGVIRVSGPDEHDPIVHDSISAAFEQMCQDRKKWPSVSFSLAAVQSLPASRLTRGTVDAESL